MIRGLDRLARVVQQQQQQGFHTACAAVSGTHPLRAAGDGKKDAATSKSSSSSSSSNSSIYRRRHFSSGGQGRGGGGDEEDGTWGVAGRKEFPWADGATEGHSEAGETGSSAAGAAGGGDKEGLGPLADYLKGEGDGVERVGGPTKARVIPPRRVDYGGTDYLSNPPGYTGSNLDGSMESAQERRQKRQEELAREEAERKAEEEYNEVLVNPYRWGKEMLKTPQQKIKEHYDMVGAPGSDKEKEYQFTQRFKEAYQEAYGDNEPDTAMLDYNVLRRAADTTRKPETSEEEEQFKGTPLGVTVPELAMGNDVHRCRGKKQGKFLERGHCLIFDHNDLHFQNLPLLQRFLSPNGMIKKRRLTGLCAKCQRKVSKTIRRSRQLGAIPIIENFAIKDATPLGPEKKRPSLFGLAGSGGGALGKTKPPKVRSL